MFKKNINILFKTHAKTKYISKKVLSNISLIVFKSSEIVGSGFFRFNGIMLTI